MLRRRQRRQKLEHLRHQIRRRIPHILLDARDILNTRVECRQFNLQIGVGKGRGQRAFDLGGVLVGDNVGDGGNDAVGRFAEARDGRLGALKDGLEECGPAFFVKKETKGKGKSSAS